MKRFAICKSCSGPVSRTAKSGLCSKCFVTPIPADFAERAVNTRRIDLIRHYGVTETIADRWYCVTGIKRRPTRSPPPDDFAAMAPTMGMAQLRRHYCRVDRVIHRWLAETGTQPLKNPPRPRADYKPRQPAQPFVWKGKTLPRSPGRDTSLHGSAAECLRRFTPVYRCREQGRADPEGEFYRYGNAVLTPDELLVRAQRHGWEATR